MKNTNTFGNAIKKLLAFALVLAIAVTFSQPLNVEAKKKAKVNKVTLAKQALSTDVNIVKSVAKPLKSGKNAVTIKRVAGNTFSSYEGYAKFVAPATKTYTLKFSNLKAKGKYTCGNISGYRIPAQTPYVVKLGPASHMYDAQLGTKNDAVYKKNVTSKVSLEEGEILYLFYNFTNKSKMKSISADVTIK